MNEVRLSGEVKSDRQAENGVLTFVLKVERRRGGYDYFECVTIAATSAYQQLEGFVTHGEQMTVIGRLQKYTDSAELHVGGVNASIRYNAVQVFVEELEDIEDAEGTDENEEDATEEDDE